MPWSVEPRPGGSKPGPSSWPPCWPSSWRSACRQRSPSTTTAFSRSMAMCKRVPAGGHSAEQSDAQETTGTTYTRAQQTGCSVVLKPRPGLATMPPQYRIWWSTSHPRAFSRAAAPRTSWTSPSGTGKTGVSRTRMTSDPLLWRQPPRRQRRCPDRLLVPPEGRQPQE